MPLKAIRAETPLFWGELASFWAKMSRDEAGLAERKTAFLG